MKDALVALAFVLPVSSWRRTALRLLGHDIAPTASVGINLVWRLGHLRMADGSHLGSLNAIRHMNLIDLADRAFVGGLNNISAHPVFQPLLPRGCQLVMGQGSVITSRHSVDASGGVFLGKLAVIAGHRSTLLSHSVDLERVAQSALPITLHDWAFAATCCVMTGGAELPPKSAMTAGSVLGKSLLDQGPGLYGGVPCRRIADFDVAWFEREDTDITDIYVPDTGVTVRQAFEPPRLGRRSTLTAAIRRVAAARSASR